MPKMNTSSQKVLKITHLFFVCLWVGGAITLALLKLGVHPDNGSALHGFDLTRTFIDDFIVIPGAVGCLLTGLVYSIFTGFGFFKLRWVAVKWVITIAGILFGTFWLGPWLNSLPPLSKQLGMEALNNPAYNYAASMNFSWSLVQMSSILFAVVISVLKPWKNK